MATETVITRESPEIEAYRLGLLESAKQLADQPEGLGLPDYLVSGLTPEQQAAQALSMAGVGSYAPFLQGGDQAIATGIAALQGATGAYDPRLAEQYMDPYQSLVIDEMSNELQRQKQIGANRLNAQAAQQGAFGGSRAAIAQQELNRNMQDQYAKNVANLLSSGYQQAQDASMQGYENAAQRALGVGTALGTMGLQTASLGELQSKLTSQDIQNLMATGGLGYEQAQAALEAERMSKLQNIYEPFQRVSYLSDIYAKTPSAQQTISAATSPSASPFQQVAGLGIAGLSAAGGAKAAGLF